ncbi:target of Nesh-SH3 isoform X3 [Austrofundulus limnaeus]|uniref:Target of Nesh-SH3 isoform X3 n=1 Tax=Austrofundulus limnaeus TaxID=52670 RepID=A0A2I4D2B9_AUSLI|nr:PREDICTED: target of Nesh-SH3-like isoform X3 [Austrofundulus limnaeus]
MQQHSNSFLFLLLMAFIAGIVLSLPPTPQRSRVRRQNMKVRISTKGDTIVMKFLHPNTDTKLEGYILGYGSSMFSKQFIQLPENGQPYETEFDAEPKYLVAVQPILTNEVKKQCTGKVQLEKPLNVVIGSVTPTSVILSWGTLLKIPYEGNVMNDCLEDGHYTVRYREKNRKWNYQTCPTSDTVIDNLKPNTVYEFGVQSNSKDGTGMWSKPVVHNISTPVLQKKFTRKIFKRPISPVKLFPPGPKSFPFPPQPAVLQNKTQGKQPISRNLIPQTTLASPITTAKQEFPPTAGPKLPVVSKQPVGGAELTRSPLPLSPKVPSVPRLSPVTVTMASVPVYQAKLENHEDHSKQMSQFQPNAQTRQIQPTTLQPSPNPHIEPEPLATSPPELQMKSEPEEKTQPLLQTHIWSPPKPEPHLQPVHQTTLQPQYEPKSQPIPTTNHQSLPPTQLLMTQNKLQAQFQPAPQPTLMISQQTIQPTPQNTPRIQETPPEIHTDFQPQPETSSYFRPQIHTKPQPMTPQTQSTQTPQRQNTIFTKSKPTTQSEPKNLAELHSSTKPGKLTPKPTVKNQQGQMAIQTPHQSHSPSKSPFQITLPTKEHPASGPHPKRQPSVQSEPQTRTQADHSKDTPVKAVHKAPNLQEETKPLPRPALATEKAGSYNHGPGIIKSSVDEVPHSPISSSVLKAGRNATVPVTRVPSPSTNQGVRTFSQSKTSSHSSITHEASGVHHSGNSLPKPVVWPGEKPVLRPPAPENKKPNLVGESKDDDKLKLEDKDSILKPIPVVTAKPKQERKHQTTTAIPAVNSSRFDMHENSSIFRPLPASEVDIMGKKRFVAPHVIYKTDKKPDEPCSITSSMAYFPDEEGSDQNVTGPPRTAPSNLTVVTVEGCPSFVILDWEKSDNDTREYEVVSITTGPHGKEVSILMTNQTHTTVENLTPESNYEFKVTPKNELGTGPSSEPVTFSTESADPRVSEHASGKNAIWTQFPFKADAYSECNGKQYIKRTWYRKFVGIQLCNSLRYKIYLSDSLNGKFYNIGDQTGYGEDHCQFVDSFLDGLTGTRMMSDQLQSRQGFFRALRHEPVHFGDIGGKSHVTYVGWYECGTPIPGKW